MGWKIVIFAMQQVEPSKHVVASAMLVRLNSGHGNSGGRDERKKIWLSSAINICRCSLRWFSQQPFLDERFFGDGGRATSKEHHGRTVQFGRLQRKAARDDAGDGRRDGKAHAK